MLSKVVEARPSLVLLDTAFGGTLIDLGSGWHNSVTALLMPLQVVDGCETVTIPFAATKVTEMWLLVSKPMLSAERSVSTGVNFAFLKILSEYNIWSLKKHCCLKDRTNFKAKI